MTGKNRLTRRVFCGAALSGASLGGALAAKKSFRVLGLYSTTVEPDHVQFAKDALKFYGDLAPKLGFTFEASTDWSKLNDDSLRGYDVVVWINNIPRRDQCAGFERYMKNGGGWLGLHVAAYNDKTTDWSWFVEFLGGGVFHSNNWPPLPAKLRVDDRKHPVTRRLPAAFESPTNEWYLWKPSPRENKDVRVLVTLDPSNYPLGKKDILTEGDLPVVWTNTKYNMLYMNMGHGDKIFADPDQNKLFEDALLWLGRKKK